MRGRALKGEREREREGHLRRGFVTAIPIVGTAGRDLALRPSLA